MSEDSNNETRRVAWINVYYTAGISVGAAIMAVGMSGVFVIFPLLRELIKSDVVTTADWQFIEWISNVAIYLIIGGGAIITGSVVNAYREIHRRVRQR